jgi:hypothetical protein
MFLGYCDELEQPQSFIGAAQLFWGFLVETYALAPLKIAVFHLLGTTS